MNRVILLGRLTKDVDLRATRTGKAVASMTIAVDRPKSRNAEAGAATADFIPLVAWDKTAEFASKYLGKGSQILVEGRMQVRSYEAQDGSKRWATEVMVNNIEFAGSKGTGAAAQPTPIDDFGQQAEEEIPF